MFLPKPRLLTCSAATLLALASCVDDKDTTVADEAEDEADDGDGDESTSEGDTEGDTGESTETGEELSDIPALGIQVTQVEANQGTAIFIAEGGAWVEGEDRLGPLISNRNSLIRVHYTVDPGWIERDIQAQLTLTYGDGSEQSFGQTKVVGGDSTPNSLGGTFYFGLIAEEGHVEPDVSFQVTLQEIDEAGEAAAASAGLAEGIWQSPSEPALLGIQGEPLQLSIVFVPFHHVYGNIDRITDTSDTVMQQLTDAIIEQNPTHELIYEIHEPMMWEYEMSSLGAVLGPMSAQRENEQTFPNVYWAGLFPTLGGGIAGVAGVAQVPGDGKGEGGQRVSVTALPASGGGSAAGTLVHELGHTEGLAHVWCPFAEAASPDPTYPYQNGLIGQWGFGILSFNLYPPDNHYDYMSYCGPSWVSTWSWNRNFARIRELTSWEFEDVGPDDQKAILIGALTADGGEYWWTVRGSMPTQASPFGDDGAQYLQFESGDGIVDVQPSVVRYANDFTTAWVMTELPAGRDRLEGIDSIVRVDDTLAEYPVAVDRIVLSARDVLAMQ